MKQLAWLVAVGLVGVASCAAGGPQRRAMAPAASGAAAPLQATMAGGISGGAGAAPMATQIPEQLVIEGTMALEVEEIGDIVPALRAYVEGAGGRVINESVSGAALSWNAQLKLRLPPGKVDEVSDWLGKRGEVTAKHVSATDVSKQLFDEELAVKNLKTTLERLTQVMATPNLQVAQILEIEKEMTRIRGQIEQLEGDERFLKDRVGLATLDVTISRKAGAVTVAKANVYPGARLTTMTLFDPRGRARTRVGAGFVLHTVLRTASLDVDVFQKELGPNNGSAKNAVIATFGGASYSDFLGRGQRQTLNPFLGLRLGYAYLDGSRFVLEGEAGLELLKSKYIVLEASARAAGMFGSRTDLALIGGLGAIVAF